MGQVLDRLLAGHPAGHPADAAPLTHVRTVAARPGHTVAWPEWVPGTVRERFAVLGVARPWAHQAQAACLAHGGESVVLATGTASGKSLGYQLPALAALLGEQPARMLYLAPTRALAADQLRGLDVLGVPGVRAATFDGDTPHEARDWVRAHANWVLTNPDMLHHTLLPAHERWGSFLRRLRYVVVDECHAYRGVFGAHVALVLRRLRRVCARYGAQPTFVLASATVADPAEAAARLTGLTVTAVTEDTSPRGEATLALWEPPLTALAGEHGVPVRRPATAEAARLLADLVCDGARTLVFTRSRVGAERVAQAAATQLRDAGLAELATRVAAYRAGYLSEERRAVELALERGELLGVAATNALELGIDVTGLDAVVIAGFPGTRASLWQQAGRAGRGMRDALAIFVAREDPLDTYLVHHPEALFDAPAEASVFDPANPHVLSPQLCAAAAEMPLRPADLPLFGGPVAEQVLDDLVAGAQLRRRPAGWYWTAGHRPQVRLRGAGAPVAIVEAATGGVVGTADADAAHASLHPGAVYLHQGRTFVVDDLDLDAGVALVHAAEVDWTTWAREVSDLAIVQVEDSQEYGPVRLAFGLVDVTAQVVGFLRRRVGTNEVLDETPLDLPCRRLRTKAVWYTVADEALVEGGLVGGGVPGRLAEAGLVGGLAEAGLVGGLAKRAPAGGVAKGTLPGAVHAAEHAAIGLLPLFATCDRWDIGGVSTAAHPDTGRASVFVHDGHDGGAGFAQRGYAVAPAWLRATRETIAACGCPSGCPSCVQSPKCGNGNDPLDKAGAVALLDVVLARLGDGDPR